MPGLLVACGARDQVAVPPAEVHAETKRDVFTIYGELEDRINRGTARESDRVEAYRQAAQQTDDGSAAYAFVRAALAGRLAELRGVRAARLVGEVETWARRSLERDPQYREQAATQMLGSLYVMAPARLVAHGDSEDGLEMLETLRERWPDNPSYALRLAQAYAFLGEGAAAKAPLCASWRARAGLKGDERKLLDGLMIEVGGGQVLACDDT